MPTITMPAYRILFGNEHWRTYRAVSEINVYCDMLDHLRERTESLETRGKDEEATLTTFRRSSAATPSRSG